MELSRAFPKSRTLSLDMPGCGTKRSRDPANETIASIARELNQDIRDAGLKNVILIGHSIAGVVLPVMAAADPTLFSELIYLATMLPLERESVTQTMGTTLQGQDPKYVGFPLDPRTTAPEALAVAMFQRDLSEEQLSWLLSEIALDSTPQAVHNEPVTYKGYDGKIPAAYILTLRDPILPAEWQRKFAARALCIKTVEMDTPHEPFVSHPQILAEAIKSIVNTDC